MREQHGRINGAMPTGIHTSYNYNAGVIIITVEIEVRRKSGKYNPNKWKQICSELSMEVDFGWIAQLELNY